MKKILHFLENDIPLIISGAALTVSVLLAMVNAILRYTISYTINGADALITLCFAYTVYVGSAAAYKRGQHYGVDVVVSRLSAKAHAVEKLVLDILIAIIIGFGFYLAWMLTAGAGSKTIEGLNIPYTWYDLAAAIGFGYSVVYSIEFIVEDIKKLTAKEKHA